MTLSAYAIVSILLLVAYVSTIRHLTKKCIKNNDNLQSDDLEIIEHPETEGMRQSGVFGLGRNHP